LRIDDELHVIGSAAVARREGAETAPEMFGFSECADAVRRNALSNHRRHDETGINRSGNRAGGCRRDGKGAVVRDRAAAEVGLVAGGVEDVS